MSGRGKIKTKVRQEVLQRDGHRCVACGATEDLQMAHHSDDAMVGEEDVNNPAEAWNLSTLCFPCHSVFDERGVTTLRTHAEREELLQLKNRFKNDWNTASYQEQKWAMEEAIDKRTKEEYAWRDALLVEAFHIIRAREASERLWYEWELSHVLPPRRSDNRSEH